MTERSLDELVETLIIETSDYKKMRLDRTIYTQFKLFNDFVEIRNSNKKENKKENEILKLNIPFKIMNHIVCLLWEGHPCSIIYTTYNNYKRVFEYLGFKVDSIKILDKFIESVKKNPYFIKLKDKANISEIDLTAEISTEHKDISSEDIKNILVKNDKYVILNMFQYSSGVIIYNVVLALKKYSGGKANWYIMLLHESRIEKMGYLE